MFGGLRGTVCDAATLRSRNTATTPLTARFLFASSSGYSRRALCRESGARRSLLATKPDCLQQLALAGVSIPENPHDHRRHQCGFQAQRIDVFIRANPIENAFTNGHVVRAKAGAIDTLVQHLCRPFPGPPPCDARASDRKKMKPAAQETPGQGVCSRMPARLAQDFREERDESVSGTQPELERSMSRPAQQPADLGTSL